MECQEESAICCIKATKCEKVSKSVVNTIATYMLPAALSLFPRFSYSFLPFPEYPREFSKQLRKKWWSYLIATERLSILL